MRPVNVTRRTTLRTSLSLLTALLILCGAVSHAFAQQTTATAQTSNGRAVSLAGRVTDSQNAALAGATVTLYPRAENPNAGRVSTTTDEAGAYRFDRLAAPGEYIVEAEARGFARSSARVVRVERGGVVVSLDIPLDVAGINTEVVVTASDTPQQTDEVSKAITVVGRAEIDERDEYSIPEALRTVPGLRVQQLGGPGAFTSIKTRGLRNQDTAVLVDGLRFRDSSSPQGDASGFLSDLLVTNTSRVEVLRGSGSSLYGTNAVGGVVNVVTDEGGGPFRGNLFAEGGSLGMFRGRAQVAGGAGAGDRLAYSAAVTHLNVARGIDGDDATRNTGAQGRVLFRLTPTATLSARVYTSQAFVQLNDNPQSVGAIPSSGIVDARPLSREEVRRFESGTPLSQLNAGDATFVPAPNDPDNSRRTRFFTGAVTFAQRPAERFGYSFTYQGLATRGQFDEGPDGTYFEPFGGNSRDVFEGRVHTLNARTDFRLGAFNFFNAGYEFESENFNNRTSPTDPSFNSSVDVTQRSHTLFIQNQIRLLDERLQLSAAFRAQFFSLSRPRFSPADNALFQNAEAVAPADAYTGDGSIAYFFRSTGTKLRAHVGNGYRAPSLYERFGTFFSSFSGSFSPFGNPSLRPERSIAFDAGLDQNFYDNRVRLSATYFYTRLQEVVGFGAFGYENTGGGLARGAELSATLAPTRTLNLFAAYTHTNSDQRRPTVGNVIRALGIPDHQFSLVATQRFGERVFVNFDLTASSNYLVGSIFDLRTFANPVYRFDGIIKADLGASYTLPLSTPTRSLRFFGKIENLFDRANYENGFLTQRRTGVAGAAYSF